MSTSAPSRGPATPAETGRSCPYCRFPLKSGVEVVRCAECAATHHADCWDENLGCAVVACAGGPQPGAHGEEASGTGKPGKGPPAGGKPEVAPPLHSRRRGPLIGAAVGLVVVVAIIALAVAVAGGGGGSSAGGGAAIQDVPADATEAPTDEPVPQQSTGVSEEETVDAMASFLDRSRRGRAATRRGDYDRANSIRESILSDLENLDTEELSNERSLLRRAMRASIKANEVRVTCPGSDCAAPYDETTTRVKQRLVDAYNAHAEEYGAETFAEEEI